MKRRLFAALLFMLLLTGCGGKTVPPPPEEPDIPPAEAPEAPPEEPQEPEPPEDPEEAALLALLEDMTLEEKAGQLFFVRVPAENAVEDVMTYHLGGYLLFGRDTQNKTASELIQTIASYQAAAELPLLIGVDEEGGAVARASRNPNLFTEKFKSPQKVFSAGGMEAIALDAVDKNRDLLRYGINVNFAPVADVSTDPADFMYDRTFGQDAEATAAYVETVVTAAGGVSAGNGDGVYKIGAVLKHFPGYGNNADTHTGVAIDERPYERFLEEDFLPFRAGIEAGAGAVLMSHNVAVSMDPDLPASLSPEVHRILREELDFQGVILTDDMAMDAVESYARDGSAAVLAVLAGNDMIVTSDFARQIPQVVEAVNGGTIDKALIDRAVERVLGWKYDLGLLGGVV